jgi:hypothetical protein
MDTNKCLLEVRIKHRFFTDGFCRNISLFPSDPTRVILRRQGILLRNLEDGFALYSTPDTHLDVDMDLRFLADSKDPSFDLYTELPDLGIGEVLHYSDQRLAPDREDLLSAGIAIQSPTGRNPPIFVLDLRIGPDAEVQAPKRHRIELSARNLLWKYYLPTDQAAEIVDLASIEPLRFHASESNPPIGYSCMVSDRAVATQEFPLQRLQLRDLKTGRVLMKRLPIPDFRKFGRERLPTGETMLAAEAYINP